MTRDRAWAILGQMRRAFPIVLTASALLATVACKDKPDTVAMPTPTSSPRPSSPTPLATFSSPQPSARPPQPPPPAPIAWDAGKSTCVPSKGTSEPRGTFRPGVTAQTAKRTYSLRDDGTLEAAAKGDAAGKPLARARPGTKIAATSFGDHEIVVFLADHKTSEGVMLQAFASIDGQAPVRVSEDGAGATSVDVAPRDKSAIIAYIDARSVMVPVHARVVEEKDGKAALGKDTVVFIGGAPDPNVAGVLATSERAAYYVLPIARDLMSFGAAIVQIDDPPHEDAKVTWSMYPYGLDPAPIAATRGTTPIHLARVVPRAAGLNAPRGIELGKIQDDGAFHSLGLVSDGIAAAWVGIEPDPSAARALLVRYVDGPNLASQTLACPP